MPEASILDYLKALVNPWQKELPVIPPLPEKGKKARVDSAKLAKKASPKAPPASASKIALAIPWKTPASLLLFVMAQILWAPPDGAVFAGIGLAAAAVGLAIWAHRLGEWRIPTAMQQKNDARGIFLRPVYLAIAFVSFGMAYFLFGGNQFRFGNVLFWMISLLALVLSVWDFESVRRFWEKLRRRFAEKDWGFSVPGRAFLLLAVIAIVAFFRFSQLEAVPIEMVSDHAEKLFDVSDILNGSSPIFFERNTGREPLQFYLTAWIAEWLGIGISFLSLKSGTTLLGFLSLYYVYQLGKDYGGRWVGLLAMLIAGVAYWPNVLARTGLRFILYPAFVAPTLLYLLRALRGWGSNNFVKAGLFLGAGLMGYTAFRIMPFIAIAALLIYWLHKTDAPQRKQILAGFAFLLLVILFVFTPLGRYAFEDNSLFNFRVNSRMLTTESPYPENPILILIKNTGTALAMPVFNAGSIWLVGLIQRPALDIWTGSIFLVGCLILFIRYLKERDWQDIFLLLSVPMLMLPSILSLAFPSENPALNRAGGAMIAIFVIAAIGLDALVHGIKDRVGKRGGLQSAWISAALILFAIAGLNYDMVFRQYADAYKGFSWNSSEIGEVIADFSNSFGSAENSWVVAYPHWVDTRLVGINAGEAGRDFGIWPDQLTTTQTNRGAKLFVLNLQDSEGMDTLLALYPQGSSTLHESGVAGKDFLVYFVPASQAE